MRTSPRGTLEAVTPYGPGAGSARVRVHEWAARLGGEVRVHPYAGLSAGDPPTLARHPVRVAAAERGLRRLAHGRPERLLLHREASPLSRGGLETSVAEAAGRSVYDFDDALYCDTGEGPWYRRWAPKAAKALAAVRSVDRVVAGNATLAAWAADHHRDVVIIPSCVEPSQYDMKDDYAVASAPRLGWVGSWSTEQHLRAIAPALHEVHRRTGARLHVVGAAEGHLGDLEAIVDRTPWSPAAQRTAIARFDVGLMPLTDDPYSRGKCGYKLLQYLAAGTPAVASPVGVNREILDRAELPAATTIDEWIGALLDLLTADSSTRAAAGDRARSTVAEHYSFAAWESRWRAAMFLDEGDS